MPLRPVLQFPDPLLKRKSAPITRVTDEIRALAADMLETMYDEPGIGLAAPQVGELVRLIVVDTTWTEEGSERSPLVLVNPEIVAREGTVLWTEGCLSVPDYQAEVERAARVRLRARDLDGKTVEIDAEELEAVCFQHEIDHLDGILFIDRLPPHQREALKPRLRQLAESGRP
jgi:peptide deformylase